MFPKACYHTHNDLCDGRAALEEFAEEAGRRGFAALGFTSHAPLPFENDWTLTQENLLVYIRRVRELKESAPLEIYLGLEIDYIPGLMGPADPVWHSYDLDYTIGSVHMLDDAGQQYSIDGPDEEFLHLLNNVYEGDGVAFAAAYYAVLTAMIRAGGFTILGHLDLIRKKNNRFSYLDEEDPVYRRAALETLDALTGSGIILEINSGGVFRGAASTVYPSFWLLEEAFKRNIPTMINADAHTPESLDFHYDQSQELARRAGYRQAMLLLNGTWQQYPL